MRRELSPLNSELSDASIFDIGRCFSGTNWYTYSVCEWQNGAKGAIVDFYELSEDVDSKGNSLCVKDEGRNLGHRDSLYFVSSEIDLVKESERYSGLSDLWTRCPLVAEGIIARFVKVDITVRNYPAMFEAYYEMEKTFYAIERKRRDPYTFNVNLEEEFANGEHLRQEQKKIEYSLQNLLPFLKESQHALIRRTADAYIAFVKSKATKTINSQALKNSGRHRNASQKEEKNYSRYSFQLNVKNKQLENLYLMLSKRDDEGERFIDGDLQKFNNATKCLPLDKEDIKLYMPVDIDKMLFNQVFAGKDTDVRIVWRGDAVELWYFINTLYNYIVNGKRLLDKSGSGPGLWQIVRFRFLNGKSRKVFDERIGKEVETDEPIEYEEKAFRKYSQKNSLSDPSVLDAIISKIAPPRDKSDKEVIEEDLNLQKYGIKSPSEAVQLGEGLHDTSHKSKY
jgi:hypothetical protein